MKKILLTILLPLVFCFHIQTACALPAFPGAEGFGSDTTAGSGSVRGKELAGSINVTGANTDVPGTGTAFSTELWEGAEILVSGETREIASVTNDTTATVTSAWGSDLADDTTPEIVTTVYKVTNLNASGGGSFYDAILQSGARTIIFEVSGTIPSPPSQIILEEKHSYLTVAGHTAPSPGIIITGRTISLGQSGLNPPHDIVFQHLRFRLGYSTSGSALDCIDVFSGYNIMIDHCSLSWGNDENIGITHDITNDVTVSNCIISENLGTSNSIQLGMLLQYSAYNISIIKNLFAHQAKRQPCIFGHTGSGTYVFCANNVIYNYLNKAIHCEMLYFTSIVGNATYTGLDSPSPRWGEIHSNSDAASRLYLNDNRCDDNTSCDPSDPSPGGRIVGSPPSGTWPAVVDVLDSGLMKAHVTTNAGARPLDRDSVDTRIIDDLNSGTGNLIDHEDDVGGFPTLAENTRTLTVPSNKDVVQGSGYTNLEEWLHFYAAGVEGTGVTYYVDDDATDDTGTGAIGDPWKTLQKAANTITGTDDVFVRAGTYANMSINGLNGTSGDWVVFRPYQSETVIIDASKTGEEYANTTRVIEMITCSYIEFRDFEITDSNTDMDSGTYSVYSIGGTAGGYYGIRYQTTSHHIRVTNCTIHHLFSTGLSDEPTCHDLEAIDNTIYDVAKCKKGYGLYWTGDDAIIRGNTIHDCYGYGIHIWNATPTPDNNLIEKNIVYDNGRSDYGKGWAGFPAGGETRGDGILVGKGSGHTIQNNIVYGNIQSGIFLFSGPNNCNIVNNTLYNNSNYGILLAKNIDNTLVRNNISYSNSWGSYNEDTSTGPVTNTTSDHNLFSSDPLFVDAASGDFHLQVNSPAINQGISTNAPNTDYDGVSRPQPSGGLYDIGAYEFLFAIELSISNPDITGNTVEVGDSYNVIFSLSDSVFTAATTGIYRETDGNGVGGVLLDNLAGSTTNNIAEGLNQTYVFDTTGMTPGIYFIYIEADNDNFDTAQVISLGTLTINAASGTADKEIDNGDAETTESGTWAASSGLNPWEGTPSSGSLFSNNAGDTYTYQYTITGQKHISLWWTWLSNRCSSVSVALSDDTSLLETFTINQSNAGLAGQWNLLTSGSTPYTFATNVKVVITAATDIKVDTFTEASNTALESHSSDEGGGSWSGGDTAKFDVIAATDIVQVEDNGANYVAIGDEAPVSADYSCEVVGRTGVATSSDGFSAVVRAIDTDNFYSAWVGGNGVFQLWKRVATVKSQLVTQYTIPSFSATQDYTILLSAVGNILEASLDGTVRLTSPPDSDIVAAGNIGITLSQTSAYITSMTSGGCTTCADAVQIKPTTVNIPPIANPDYGVTTSITPAIINLSGNDSDPDGDGLDLTSLATATGFLPAKGNEVYNGDGTVTYTYTSSDSLPYIETFRYTIKDTNATPAISNSAEVTLVILSEYNMTVSPVRSIVQDIIKPMVSQ